jgi:hypothetical protein
MTSQGEKEDSTNKRRKPKWIGHILRWNCSLKHVIEGKIERRIEVMGRQGMRCKQLLDDLQGKRLLEIVRGSTRFHSVGNLFWKKLWTCHKTDK